MKRLLLLLTVLLTLSVSARCELYTVPKSEEAPVLYNRVGQTVPMTVIREGGTLSCAIRLTGEALWLSLPREHCTRLIAQGVTCIRVQAGEHQILLTLSEELLSRAASLGEPLGEFTCLQLCLMPGGGADLMLVCGEYTLSSLQFTADALVIQ